MTKWNILKCLFWLPSLLVLFACASEPKITSSAQILPGHSLVLSKSYQEIFRPDGTIFRPEPFTVYNDIAVTFRKFDPPKPKSRFSWRGGKDEIYAANAMPGKYHFSSFAPENADFYYLFEPHNKRYELDIREGEAVYFGDIVVVSRGTRFRIAIRDEETAARAFFEENFADSGLTFTKRLMHRVYGIEPILPK